MVDELTSDELTALWCEVEAAVDATPGIDHWCSGPDWQLPVAEGFAPKAGRLLLATGDRRGFAMLARYRSADGRRLLGGLEPLWGFGTPIVGADAVAVATALVEELAPRQSWDALVLSGMPLVGERVPTAPPDRAQRAPHPDPLTLGVAFALSPLGSVGFGEGITRQIADLGDGYEAWLARRGARFRRNLRQAEARAADAGVSIEDIADRPDVLDRLLDIEHRSWKGREGSGITSVEMTTMYRAMIDRLAERGRLQVHVARLGDHDIGYILGGVRAGRYRGLQLSYTEEARHLSVGNVLQLHQLRQLDRHGLADTYDLGMDFDYKRRWADRAETSVTVVVQRS